MGLQGPEEVVQQQVIAYNAHDVGRFMTFYSPDVVITELPEGRVTVNGHEELRSLYTTMFQNSPNLNCEIVKRTVVGNMVVDEESLTGLPSGRSLRAVAVYEVADAHIHRVWMIQEKSQD